MCFSYVSSICACLDLSVSSSSWCLGRAAVCDCGTPWTFLLPFLPQRSVVLEEVLFILHIKLGGYDVTDSQKKRWIL